jgi:hypothetical protein
MDHVASPAHHIAAAREVELPRCSPHPRQRPGPLEVALDKSDETYPMTRWRDGHEAIDDAQTYKEAFAMRPVQATASMCSDTLFEITSQWHIIWREVS